MRRVAALVGVAFILLPTAAADDWPATYGDEGNRSARGAHAWSDGGLKWKDRGTYVEGPVLAEGVLVVGGADFVRAYDAGAGQRSWTREFATRPGRPIIGGGLIYVPLGPEIVALDLDGATRWTRPSQEGRPLALTGEVLYVAERDGSTPPRLKVTAVDASNGAARWSYLGPTAPRDVDHWGLATRSPRIFINLGAHLVALDPNTGMEKWRFTPAAPAGDLHRPMSIPGHVYVTDDRRLWALDASSGQPLWNFTVTDEGGLLASPIHSYGRVMVGTPQDGITAVDADSGRFLWRTRGSTDTVRHLATEAGRVYASGSALSSFEASDGGRRWRLGGLEAGFGAPALLGGSIFILHDGTLFAFDAASGDIPFRLTPGAWGGIIAVSSGGTLALVWLLAALSDWARRRAAMRVQEARRSNA